MIWCSLKYLQVLSPSITDYTIGKPWIRSLLDKTIPPSAIFFFLVHIFPELLIF